MAAVLYDPGLVDAATAQQAQPKAEAGHVVVEDDQVRFAGHREPADRFVVELQPKNLTVAGSIREAKRCFPMHPAAPARQRKIHHRWGKVSGRALPAPRCTTFEIDEPL